MITTVGHDFKGVLEQLKVLTNNVAALEKKVDSQTRPIDAKVNEFSVPFIALVAGICALAAVGAVTLISMATGSSPYELITVSSDGMTSAMKLIYSIGMDYIVAPCMSGISLVYSKAVGQTAL